MQTTGLNLLARLLADQRLEDFYLLKEDYFFDDEKPIYNYVARHVERHGALPSLTLTKRRTELDDPDSEDDYGVWRDEYINRALYQQFNGLMGQLTKSLNNRDSVGALDRVTQFLEETHSIRTDGQQDLIELPQMGQEVLENLIQLREVQGLSGIPSNWITLDRMTQGYQNGDLIVYAARPGVGKTTTMLYGAMQAYRHGYIPLFVSMEMKRIQIGKRLMAMFGGLNMTPLQRGRMTTRAQMRLEQQIHQFANEDGRFYFIEGQFRKHVGELASLVHSLRPNILFVDGAYLLRLQNVDARMALWERIGEISQALKNIGAINNIPVVASFQITREGGKKDKTGKDVGVEHLMLSDTIGQLASLVVGIFQDDPEASMEAEVTRRMKILKGREGEHGQFYINYNFSNMDFSERIDPLADPNEDDFYEHAEPEDDPDHLENTP